MKRVTIYALFLVLAMTLSFDAQAEEVRYITHIKPLFTTKCSRCHGAESPEYPEFKANKKIHEDRTKGPRMNSYACLIFFTGCPDTGALMRRLDDGKNAQDGKPANMHKYLVSTDEERQQNPALFKEWIGNWTLKRWPEVTKEQMNGIKVEY